MFLDGVAHCGRSVESTLTHSLALHSWCVRRAAPIAPRARVRNHPRVQLHWGVVCVGGWGGAQHFVKDLGIALTECQTMKLALPGLALAQQLYVSLEAAGEGDSGTQALVHALERLNHTTLPLTNR